MTFSYDTADLSTELNKIRLYIGDVDSNDVLLENEEIALIQADSSTFLKRCAECCRLICAKVIRRVDGKFGNLTEKSSSIYDHYKEKADTFDSLSSSSYPWMGSLYQDDKDDMEDEQDDGTYTAPSFRRGAMDNK